MVLHVSYTIIFEVMKTRNKVSVVMVVDVRLGNVAAHPSSLKALLLMPFWKSIFFFLI